MFTRIRNMHPLGIFAAGVVATLVLSGTAIAITDTSFTYSSVKTGYLTISPMDLAPGTDEVATGDYDVTGSRLAHRGLGGCYNTGVNLPQNARITTVQTYYRSNTNSSSFALVRNYLATDTLEWLAWAALPDTDMSRTSVTSTVSSAARTVWNNVYSYGFEVCLAAPDSFGGARITYTYTSAGD